MSGRTDRARRWTVVAWTMLLIGVVFSVAAAAAWRGDVKRDSERGFHATASDVTATLVTMLQRDADLVVTMRALATMEPRLTDAEFARWYSSMGGRERQQKGIGIGVIESVPASRLAAFRARYEADGDLLARAGGRFRIFPAGTRSRYCLIRAWVGLQQGGSAPALPLLTDLCAPSLPGIGRSPIPATFDAETDTGQMAAGPGLPPSADNPSMFISAPVYRRGARLATIADRRAALRGWVTAAFDRFALLRAAIGTHRGLQVELYRQNPGEYEPRLLAQLGQPLSGHQVVRSEPVAVHGAWVVKVRGVPGAHGLDAGTQGLIVLSSGLLVSVLMFLLIRLLSRSRERAFVLVRQKTGQLRHQALHDALTGLPNRALVLDRAEQMLARARREREPIAALYVDLDGFKQINDTFGHGTGDELLNVVGARLTGAMREGDTVGRIGGDEFVVLVDASSLDAGPGLVAERILDVLSQPVVLDGAEGRPLSVSASVGIALGLRASAEDLLRDADVALYEAKRAGKDRYMVFESQMQTAARDRLKLEMDLREALDDEQFFLLYQPTFDLRSRTVTGVEALIRWRHPTRGVIPPEGFVPITEESGLIVPIGRWVLREACRQAAEWRGLGHPLGMAVNVSARQLDRNDLIDDVRDALDASGLDPAALTLEITETVLMRDAEAAARRLQSLKALGVRLAIDDFGTGYSSLAYLRQFPVDSLKIDRSFISGIAASKESAALIHTLVQLGKTLDLDTLGEGIEEPAQLRQLQREQCDFGQGFLFARPLTAAGVLEFVESTPATAAAREYSAAVT